MASKTDVKAFELPVPGLFYIPEFLTEAEQQNIVQILDSNEWEKVIRRRQQFYGKQYYHTTHNLTAIQPKDDLESLKIDQFDFLIKKITDFDFRAAYDVFNIEWPNQILVNEYVENFGISTHFDDEKAFGKCIITVSLLQPILMNFRKPLHPTNHCTTLIDEYQHVLEPRSCLIMSKEARSNWRHGITRRKWFEYNGEKIHRNLHYRRISLTIRNVLDTRKKVETSDYGIVKVKECECIVEE
eukprot:NODE_166_length_14584_cov_1.124750.p8 type:complete len:242 gc:universal NODE_166_length_14584_cov_1.124750:6805-7530(+)